MKKRKKKLKHDFLLLKNSTSLIKSQSILLSFSKLKFMLIKFSLGAEESRSSVTVLIVESIWLRSLVLLSPNANSTGTWLVVVRETDGRPIELLGELKKWSTIWTESRGILVWNMKAKDPVSPDSLLKAKKLVKLSKKKSTGPVNPSSSFAPGKHPNTCAAILSHPVPVLVLLDSLKGTAFPTSYLTKPMPMERIVKY